MIEGILRGHEPSRETEWTENSTLSTTRRYLDKMFKKLPQMLKKEPRQFIQTLKFRLNFFSFSLTKEEFVQFLKGSDPEVIENEYNEYLITKLLIEMETGPGERGKRLIGPWKKHGNEMFSRLERLYKEDYKLYLRAANLMLKKFSFEDKDTEAESEELNKILGTEEESKSNKHEQDQSSTFKNPLKTDQNPDTKKSESGKISLAKESKPKPKSADAKPVPPNTADIEILDGDTSTEKQAKVANEAAEERKRDVRSPHAYSPCDETCIHKGLCAAPGRSCHCEPC